MGYQKKYNVNYRNRSDEFHGLAIAGPRSRELLQKICRENDPVTTTSFGSVSAWEVADWDEGVTEPASSGSPLFNQNQLLIGQLYGGSAACNGTTDNNQDDNNQHDNNQDEPARDLIDQTVRLLPHEVSSRDFHFLSEQLPRNNKDCSTYHLPKLEFQEISL